MGTATGNTAVENALIVESEKGLCLMNSDYKDALVAYRTTMSLAEGMLHEGIITERDYGKIDRIIANKYGLSLSSICCRKPLITTPGRVNMQTTKGDDLGGKDD